jgi:hypothetical protein
MIGSCVMPGGWLCQGRMPGLAVIPLDWMLRFEVAKEV